MIDWYKKVIFDNYANFSGRARRSEYWYFTLINLLIVLTLCILLIVSLGIFGNNDYGEYSLGIAGGIMVSIISLYALITFIPRLAVTVRRLHDLGYSGWMYLIAFVPGGSIIILVFLCMDSQPFDNRWGPNPKKENNFIDEIGKQIEDKY